MADEAIRRNIRGLGNDRAQIRTEYTRIPMQAFKRIRCRDFAHPEMENLDRRRSRSCEGDRRNLPTDRVSRRSHGRYRIAVAVCSVRDTLDGAV